MKPVFVPPCTSQPSAEPQHTGVAVNRDGKRGLNDLSQGVGTCVIYPAGCRDTLHIF